MWILILVIYTTSGEFVPYEQGIYKSFSECYDTKNAMLSELNGAYRATCMEWK
jgi:hypothetical protein